MLIRRELLSKIEKIKKSILLLGPRQTGKSTLMRQLGPDFTIDLADQQEFSNYLSDPGLLAKTTQKHSLIFIDEVQRIPSLLNTVQAIVDRAPDKRFLLTGSSARKLRRGQANLLPGRVVTYSLGPLSLSELPAGTELEDVLRKGLLPGIFLEPDEEVWKKVLRSYSATYLKEEIQAEALTRNLEGFSRFFRIAVSRSGDFVDLSKFASQAEIERTSARRYFEILEDTLVLNCLDPFTKSHRTRLVQHPRFYFFDVGVLNGALSNFEATVDRRGRIFEHLCLQLIVSAFKNRDRDVRISTYRTSGGAEVDFIIEFGTRTIACEIKSAAKIVATDFTGLRSFQNFYGEKCELMVLYPGRHAYDDAGVQVLPWMQGIARITGD